MTLIDFIIGLTLMNSMPHFVLGLWNAPMLSGFGYGDKQNLAYSILNFIISMGLFIYQYGFDQLLENGIYVGALFTLVMYFLTGKFWRDNSRKKVGEV